MGIKIRMSILNEIKSGLKNNEFFLEYLPTIQLENNRCIGGEALIRWRRSGETILPMHFIPLVENTPVSGHLTYWVIETVAQEMGPLLRANDDIHISINVPPELLGRGGLEYAAEKCGLMDVLNKLIVEVTERGVPDKLGLDALQDALQYAAGSRVRVALDDFGINDMNLVLLSRVNVDIIKVDKSFTDQMMEKDWSDEKIKKLSIFLRATDHTIIVEGVESQIQVDILKEAGVKLVQGWYFSQSLPANEFETYFNNHR